MPDARRRPDYGRKWRPRPDGYIDIWEPTHPLARRDGYVFEHRKVAWDAGLLTDPAMHVHHQNHVRWDNHLSNLEVKTGQAHARDHAEEAGEITNQFGTFPVKPRERRQGAPRPVRPCEGCGQQIPLTRRRDALYCSDNCRVTTWKRAHRAARGADRPRSGIAAAPGMGRLARLRVKAGSALEAATHDRSAVTLTLGRGEVRHLSGHPLQKCRPPLPHHLPHDPHPTASCHTRWLP